MTRVYSKLFLIFCTALLLIGHEITIQIALPEGLHFDSNPKHHLKDRRVLCDTARILTSSAISKSLLAFILSPQRNIQVGKVETLKLINDELTVGWVVLQKRRKAAFTIISRGYPSLNSWAVLKNREVG